MLTTMNLAVISIVTFGTSLFVVTTLIRMITASAAGLEPNAQRTSRRLTMGLILWPFFAVLVGATIELTFPVLGIMLAGPLLIGSWIITRPSVSEILRNIPLYRLVALSFYRVVGLLFIYIYFSSGALTRGFAMNAGWGDLITGLLALPVAWMVFKNAPLFKVALLAWSAFGICDLILAPLSAFLYGPSDLTVFPLNVIPIFLGPPFGIMLHLIVLRAAWLQGRLSVRQGKTQTPINEVTS